MKVLRTHWNHNTIKKEKEKKEKEKEITEIGVLIKKEDILKVKNTNINIDIIAIVKDVKREDENTIFIEPKKIDGLLVEESEGARQPKENEYSLQSLMAEMLPKVETETETEKNTTFEITLTKRQKEIFDNKGGVKWLKKMLIGGITKKNKKKKK